MESQEGNVQPRGRSLKRSRRSYSVSSSRGSRSFSRSRYGRAGTSVYASKKSVRLFPSSTIRLPISAMPASVVMPLTYSETVGVNCTSGASASYVYRMNSLYDPNFTGTGHQPYYFDEMMNLYTTYVVYGCQVEIEFSSAATVPITCVYIPSLNSTSATDAVLECEKPHAKCGVLGPGSAPLFLKTYYDVGRVYGSSKNQILTDIAWQATSTTNPSTVAYLKISVRPVDNTTTVAVYMNVKLKFYVTFKQRIEQSES